MAVVGVNYSVGTPPATQRVADPAPAVPAAPAAAPVSTGPQPLKPNGSVGGTVNIIT